MEDIQPEHLLLWTYWVTYAASTREQKRLLAKAGESLYRVVHGQMIVYEGTSATMAAIAYNKIKTPPNEDI